MAGTGLSPPTRGSQHDARNQQRGRRSIPAHTGKPRARGEPARQHGGLSPPTRGSRAGDRRTADRRGSIPAHTGKPVQEAQAGRERRVYPRPHGEAAPDGHAAFRRRGLSPPTRGSHHQCQRAAGPRRSIPAHTGKPPARGGVGWRHSVYPRPHGEADSVFANAAPCKGLSPPTRGSHGSCRYRRPNTGSIPAHTGKPRPLGGRPILGGVYPRPHGEAANSSRDTSTTLGLSPPTRGSLRDGDQPRRHLRSIPAHTGKPRHRPASRRRVRVYPRPHGEATKRWPVENLFTGLSPPTRGSHQLFADASDRPGSIPAHTGKPSWT